MAELRATPQQPQLGAIARGLRSLQELAGQYQVLPQVPLLGGMGVDELFGLPGAAREVENWSYGNAPMRINPYAGRTASFVPEVKPGRKSDLADVALLGADVAGLASPIGRAVAKTSNKLGDVAVRAITRNPAATSMGVLEEAAAMNPLSSIVKHKGGNWYKGEVEFITDPLRTRVIGQEPANRLRDLETSLAQNIEAGVPVDMGIVERERARLAPDIAINRWIDTKLNKYIRNEMGTPEDPVRALAERGVLHFQPRGIRDVSPMMNTIRQQRILGGFPEEGMATTPLGQQWERYADVAIDTTPSQIRTVQLRDMNTPHSRKRFEDNPWLEKLPPNTPVYTARTHALDEEALGFPHLIDELKAAMDPNSELPANLRIDLKDIDKITVPQAVERVAKINAWRAEEAAKAEKAGMMANLEGAARVQDPSLNLSFVEKPGGTWIDLPEATEGKNINFCTTIGKQGGWCTMNEGAARQYGSGDNRLAVLVDAEGRPHLQAMISTPSRPATVDEIESLIPQAEEIFNNLPKYDDRLENPDLKDSYIREIASNLARKSFSPNITQLKPPENSFNYPRSKQYIERDPEYKAKMTDAALNFLNSRQWGQVKDLDLFNIVDAQNPDHVVRELRGIYGRNIQPGMDAFNAAVDADPYAPRFMKRSDFLKFIEPFEPLNPPEGMAGGGLVSIAKKYFSTAAKEAAKDAAKEQKMLQGVYRGYAGERGDEEKLFASPQRRVGEYYAEKRAAQTGEEPHVEMLLVDPFAGKEYGHILPIDKLNRDFTVTRARKLSPEDVEERTQLKSHGGAVQGYEEGGAVEAGVVRFDPDLIDRMAADLLGEQSAPVEPAPASAAEPDRSKKFIRPEELQLREGAASVRPVRGGQGYNARLAADVAPGLQPFVDIDPWRKLIAQYGVEYQKPLPGGGASAQLVVDPVNDAKVLSGAYRQQLGKDSEISARGAVVQGAGRPNYNVGIQYRKTFAGGGLAKMLGKYAGKSAIREIPSASSEVVQILSPATKQKNLQKFVEPSESKQRVFHGTNQPERIVEDDQFAHYGPSDSDIHWFSESPKHAEEYTTKYGEYAGEQGALFPVYLQIKNPLQLPFNMNDRLSKKFNDFVRELGVDVSEIKTFAEEQGLSKPTKVWQVVNTPLFREAAQKQGYDGIKVQEQEFTTWGTFDPTKIKSQFNRGSYDVTTPDIGMATGGLVEFDPDKIEQLANALREEMYA